VLSASSIPSDRNLNATIGNGFLGTACGSDTVFIAGMFNGESNVAPSHRARVPGFAAVTFTGSSDELFALDLRRGVFVHRANVSGGATVEHTTYAHRKRRGLLVNQFCLVGGSNFAQIDLSVNEGPPSSGDLTNAVRTVLSSSSTLWSATTQTAESFLSNTTNVVCVFSTVPNVLLLNNSFPCVNLIASFAISLESSSNITETAIEEYESALSLGPAALIAEHENEWISLGVCERMMISNSTLEWKRKRMGFFFFDFVCLQAASGDFFFSLLFAFFCACWLALFAQSRFEILFFFPRKFSHLFNISLSLLFFTTLFTSL
jgi:hypothetical protein